MVLFALSLAKRVTRGYDRKVRCAFVAGLVLALCPSPARPQALPPPRDGDIRVLYYELRDLTEVWLTLELRGPGGEKLPAVLIFHVDFPGRRPAAALTKVEVQAQVGRLWAPRPELRLALDGGEAVDLGGLSPIYDGGESPAMTAVVATIPVGTLKKIAAARAVTGNALRVDFTLTATQRQAIAAFAERVLSADPGRAAGRG